MTQFEEAVMSAREGTSKTPFVSSGGRNIDYFGYQLSVHLMYLRCMAKGIQSKMIRFKDIKQYYGLKGRTAKDCVSQLEGIIHNYKQQFSNQ